MKLSDTVTDYIKPSRVRAVMTAHKPFKRKARLTPYDKGKDRQKALQDVLEGF